MTNDNFSKVYFIMGHGDHGGYPYSRDFADSLKCKASQCPYNNCGEYCISVACVSIGTDGKCEVLSNYLDRQKEESMNKPKDKFSNIDVEDISVDKLPPA